ncbi:MAG: beta-propeller fold lactonase family protein, partial [Planctomycetaceae bacterium]|nr:beta-propeller fold lactonase family protein [Planctomycetaceae bacterium]
VKVYRFNSGTGELNDASEAIVPDGGGPRHFSLHPTGRFAASNNELTSEVTVFRRSIASGELEPFQQISTLPDGFDGRRSTAECLYHPGGQFLYVSNRGHDSIAVYSVNQNSGELTRVEVEPTGGMEPRNFIIDPTGRWLLAENQNSSTVHVFAIDQQTGALEATGNSIQTGKPVCIRMIPME